MLVSNLINCKCLDVLIHLMITCHYLELKVLGVLRVVNEMVVKVRSKFYAQYLASDFMSLLNDVRNSNV